MEYLPPVIPNLDEFYASDAYREEVGEGTDINDYHASHDAEQFSRLHFLNGLTIRDQVVADIGCAAGSLLDVLRGWSSETIAIEPARKYHAWLAERGHRTYESVEQAIKDWEGKVDLAICFSVLEHVLNPVEFLAELKRLLSRDGIVVLATPNRDDVLIEACPDSYPSFFYRVVHVHYFEERSIRRAFESAGFSSIETRFHQRFGFTNFCNWLRHGKPTGDPDGPLLDKAFETQWRLELERRGRSDYLICYAS